MILISMKKLEGMVSMSKTKTIMFGDFDKQTTETLSNIIDWELNEEDIKPYSYAFHIEVEYIEEDKSNDL